MSDRSDRLQPALPPPFEPEAKAFAALSLQLSTAYDVLPDDSFGAAIGGELSILPWLHLRTDVAREAALGLVRARYSDFGPTFAHEKLTEVHGLKVSVSTLRA